MIDVARRAGVSRTAVSAVLSNGGKGKINIAAETALRIRMVAKELGFHPNHAARQLAGKRSGIIGVLGKTFLDTELRILGSLHSLASQRNVKILAWSLEAHPERLNAFVEECRGWNVDGLIYLAFKYDEVWPMVADALKRMPRVVSLLGDPGIPGGHAVVLDVARAVQQTVAHLHGRGYHRIVQVLEGLKTSMDRQRYAAFLDAHRHFYGSVDEHQICFATEGWRLEEYDKYRNLVTDIVVQRRADAILCDSDFSAPGIVRELTKLGYRIPHDVAVIGWGGEAVARGVSPSLTTIDFNIGDTVEVALDMLSDLLDRPDVEQPASVSIRPKLVLRETA